MLIVVAALAVMQCLVSGSRLLFCIPALSILAVAAIASLRDFRRPKLRPDFVCLGASAAFFGYLIVRAIASPVPYLSSPDIFSILGCLTVYLLVACHITDPRRRLWILGGLLALAALNLGVGARQFATNSGYMLFGFLRSDAYLGRASGLYICPNHLAGYLEMVGSLTLAAAIWSRLRPWIKLLLGYGALCCFGGLLMTGSRGGFLGAVTALVFLAVLGLRRSRENSPETFKRVVLIALLFVTLAAVGVTAVVKNSRILHERGSHLVSTGDDRLRLWPAAIKEFQLSPWIGTGAGTYLYYGRLFRDPAIQMDPIRTHNDYLQLLAEDGALGVFLLLVFLAAHVRWGWRAFRHLSLRFGSSSVGGGSNAAALNIGALTALVALSVHSAVDFNLHIPANALVMAFVFGLLANPGRELSDAGQNLARFGSIDWLPRLALPALGVVILAWGLPKLPGEYYGEQARVALRDKRPLAALHQAQLGIERDPSNPYLHFYLGEARQTMADRAKNPDISQSLREAAIEPYQQAVKLFPQDVRLLLRLGQALTITGHFDEAGKVMDEALKWDPNSGRVQTYYGFYLQQAGRLREAQTAYRRATELTPNPSADAGMKQVAHDLAADSPPQ